MEGAGRFAAGGLRLRELASALPNEVIPKQEPAMVAENRDVEEVDHAPSDVECTLDPEYYMVVESSDTTDTADRCRQRVDADEEPLSLELDGVLIPKDTSTRPSVEHADCARRALPA
jgi:hypothetical protein